MLEGGCFRLDVAEVLCPRRSVERVNLPNTVYPVGSLRPGNACLPKKLSNWKKKILMTWKVTQETFRAARLQRDVQSGVF